jgi:hypothetical protein
MALIMGFLISLIKYLLIILKTKLYKVKLLFMIVFKALIHVLPFASNMFNVNVIY